MSTDGQPTAVSAHPGPPPGPGPAGAGGAEAPPIPTPVSPALAQQRPEVLAGAAFAGGLLTALLLRRLRGRR